MKTILTDELTFEILQKEKDSMFDWINIERGNDRIGKVRSIIEANRLTINSINIFSEFEGQGYGTRIVNMFKDEFDTIVADRVRPTARGFWEKMGFYSVGKRDYIWSRSSSGKYKSDPKYSE